MSILEKKLSIILPVYNVEDYLERCIRSLEEQDVPQQDYEVIVVNDGSVDDSRGVVMRLMKEFHNIVFIEQENKGVSLARNAGTAKATGKYLLFVDPDDYILPNTFKDILSAIDDFDVQVMYLGYRFLDEDGKLLVDVLNEHLGGRTYSGQDTYFLSRAMGFPDPDRSWSILYRTDFIKNSELFYVAQIPYLEDGEFVVRVLCLAERCAFDIRAFYMRTTRPGSATNSNLFYQERAIDGFIKAAKNLMEFRKRYSTIKHSLFLNHAIAKFTLLSIQACVSRRSFRLFKSTRKKLGLNCLLKLKLQGCRSIYYYYGVLYNLSVWLFFSFLFVRALFLKTSRKYILKNN